jgi:hypothetical protein
MGAIRRLSVERGQLQTRLTLHRWSDCEGAAWIQAISTELEAYWSEGPRSRAARRARMEEALGVILLPARRQNVRQRRRRHTRPNGTK